MKKFIATAVITAVMTTTVFASSNTIMVNGTIKHINTALANENGYTLINAKDLGDLLGAKTEIKENEVIFTLGDKSVSININSVTFFADKTKSDLPVKPKVVNGQIILPLRPIAEALGAKVEWNASNKMISLQPAPQDVTVPVVAKSDEVGVKVYTYEEALNVIIKSNSNLKSLKEGVDYMDEQIEKIADNYRTFLSMGVAVRDTTIETVRALKSLQNQRANVELNEQLIKDSSELMLRTHLTAIAGYEQDIKLLEEEIALDKVNFKNLQLKQELGMASSYDVTVARQNLEQSETKLSASKISLDNERVALNNTMKLKPDAKIRVEFVPEVKKFELDVNSHIRRKMDTDINIKVRRQAIEEAEYRIDTRIDTEESRLANENTLRQAIRDLDDAKLKLDKNIRNAYTNIKQLEERQKSLELDLKKMKDNLKKMQANLEAGLVTPYDVMSVQLGVTQAEIALKKNEYSHSNLLFSIDHPYLLG